MTPLNDFVILSDFMCFSYSKCFFPSLKGKQISRDGDISLLLI